MNMNTDITLKNEIIRKTIHISTAVIPLYYLYFGTKNQLVFVISTLLVLFLAADISRIYFIQLSQIYEKLLGNLLRPEEKNKSLNGATLLISGFFIAVVFFEKQTAIILMLFIAIADSMAAIVGKSIGRISLFNKTLEGTITFFIAACLISLAMSENLVSSLFVGAFTALIEVLPIKINDNIAIPIAAGSFYAIADKLFIRL